MRAHLALGLAAAVSAAIPVSGWIHAGDRMSGAGIAAAPDGVLYFVDRARDVVWRLEEGALQQVVAGRKTHALQVAEDGTLIGTSPGERAAEAWQLTAAGEVRTIARGGSGAALVVDRERRLWGWTDGPRHDEVRVWRSTEGGSCIEVAGWPHGQREIARLFPIGAMTLAGDGSVLLTSGPTVRQVHADGRVQLVAAETRWLSSPGALLQRLFGAVRGHLAAITTDARGAIYVANAARNVVARIADGRTTMFYESPRGWRPVGVSAQRGRVYVLEYGAGVRVQVLDRRGKATSLVQLPA